MHISAGVGVAQGSDRVLRKSGQYAFDYNNRVGWIRNPLLPIAVMLLFAITVMLRTPRSERHSLRFRLLKIWLPIAIGLAAVLFVFEIVD
jgi:protein-S-isoprenylcysteine O-methyltransferase Ste14